MWSPYAFSSSPSDNVPGRFAKLNLSLAILLLRIEYSRRLFFLILRLGSSTQPHPKTGFHWEHQTISVQIYNMDNSGGDLCLKLISAWLLCNFSPTLPSKSKHFKDHSTTYLSDPHTTSCSKPHRVMYQTYVFHHRFSFLMLSYPWEGVLF